jgi:hypothetical protein
MIIILLFILSLAVCTIATPMVNATKLSASDRALGLLRDLFDLDLAKYDVMTEENILSESFLGDVVYESVLCTLTSKEGDIRVVFSFVDGHLCNMYVFENSGGALVDSVNAKGVVVSTQNFLDDYSRYSSALFFDDLKLSLDDVVANKNQTRVMGDVVLEVSFYDSGEAGFLWYCTVVDNAGGSRTAVVSIGFKDGVLVSFSDSWSVYGVNGNGLVKTDDDIKRDAEVAGQFFGGLGLFGGVGCFVVVGLLVVFGSSLFLWRSRVNFVFLRRFFVQGFGLFFGLMLLLAIFLPLVESVSALPAGVVWGSRSSGAVNGVNGSFSWRKTDSEIDRQKVISEFVVSSCLTVGNGYKGFSDVWSNKSSILSQAKFLSRGYDYVAVFDWDHGVGGYPGTDSSYLMPENEVHYMFEDDFGTFVGVPSGFEVDASHGVFDVDIYEAFAAGKVHFAFINTCLSADIELFGQGFSASGHPLGMPFAFTHRMVGYVSEGSNSTLMSDDGYNRPDNFPQCYIGFPFGSAALDQYIGYNGNWQPWYEWVTFFCYMAFNFDVSVNNALDWACSMQWGCPSFRVSPLQGEGFTAVWPVWNDTDKVFNDSTPNAQGPHSTLAVYGNGNIHLKNFQAEHLTTYPYVSGPKSSDTKELSSFSAYSVDSFSHDVRYIFDWGDGTQQTITEYVPAGVPVEVSHMWTLFGAYKVTVRAQCEDGALSDWSEEHQIIVGSYYEIITVVILVLSITILLAILWYQSKSKANKHYVESNVKSC